MYGLHESEIACQLDLPGQQDVCVYVYVCAHKTSRLGRRRSVVPFTFFKRHIHWKDMAIGTIPFYTPRYIGQLKQCIP